MPSEPAPVLLDAVWCEGAGPVRWDGAAPEGCGASSVMLGRGATSSICWSTEPAGMSPKRERGPPQCAAAAAGPRVHTLACGLRILGQRGDAGLRVACGMEGKVRPACEGGETRLARPWTHHGRCESAWRGPGMGPGSCLRQTLQAVKGQPGHGDLDVQPVAVAPDDLRRVPAMPGSVPRAS